jgi:hypothetical protein
VYTAQNIQEIKQIIYDSAADLGAAGEDNDYGAGVVDALAAVGSAVPQEHDLAVRGVVAPPWTEPGSSVPVNVTVQNQGASNETDVVVRLFADGNETAVRVLPGLASGAAAVVGFTWTAGGVGPHTLEGRVAPAPNETALGNNQRSTGLRVVDVAGTVRVAVFDSPGIGFSSYFGWNTLAARWYDFGNFVV